MATPPASPQAIAHGRAGIRSARIGALSNGCSARRKRKPERRWIITGDRPAASDVCEVNVNAMPNNSPAPKPSTTPILTLPMPPRWYVVRTRAMSPSAIPHAATVLGEFPLNRSYNTGTAASSTDAIGATMPIRATV